MINCSRKGCKRQATHHISWRVWGRGMPKSSTPVEGDVDLPLCRQHARDVSSAHFMTDASWAVVEQRFRAMGMIPPARSALEIKAVKGLRVRGQRRTA